MDYLNAYKDMIRLRGLTDNTVKSYCTYIRAYLASHPHADFREMLEQEDSKEEIIVTFLVILELMKNQMIRITQEETFGKIAIDLVDPNEPEPEAAPQEPEEEPQEREPEPAPIPEEPEPILQEPALRRHLVSRPRRSRAAGSRHAFPRSGSRTSKSAFRNARGSRIWNRKRNRGSILRQLKK